MARPTKVDLNQYTVVDLTDHRLDVAELSLLERGVYDSLRMVYIEQARPLSTDVDALCRLIGTADKRERNAVTSVLAKRFTIGADGRYHNERCDRELARINERRKTARTNAKGGCSNDGSCLAPPDNECNEGNKGNECNERNERNTSIEEVEPLPVRDVPRNAPAPPKNTDKVGAHMEQHTNCSTTNCSTAEGDPDEIGRQWLRDYQRRQAREAEQREDTVRRLRG